jgi:hypothetical protein
MPRVLDQDHGRLIVTAHGKRHVITCAADPISQRAKIHDDVTDCEKVKSNGFAHPKEASFFSGTEVRVEWSALEEDGVVQWPFPDGDGQPVEPLAQPSMPFAARDSLAGRLRELVEGFAIFNPHATIRLDWFGHKATWKATDRSWKKWRPHQPTSAHWYELPNIARLIGAYITHDKEAGTDRLVSAFLAEFDGLSGSLKRSRVLDEAGMHRVKFSELVTGGHLDLERIGKLLGAMQKHTSPVNSVRLGLIGADHLKARLLALGIMPESFRYSKKLSSPKSKNSQPAGDEKASFLPGVLESAFGYLGPNADNWRRIYSAVNWSAAIKNPFRSFGATGEGLETLLANLRATRGEPVVFVLHLAQPRVQYADRGKSSLLIGGAP